MPATPNPTPNDNRHARALWRIYGRPDVPDLWSGGGNLPWDDPVFSERMLRQHLDETHGAATRTTAEREQQLGWLWARLGLAPGSRALDLTCGPGLYAVSLAERDCVVTGVDFGPASIDYARELAIAAGVTEVCNFVLADVRDYEPEAGAYDAALILYGQLAVFPRAEAAALLRKVARALRPGGRLLLEMLDQDRVDKDHSTWWFTDNSGLWGERPFLHLGERFWDPVERVSSERYHILDLESAELLEVLLCDQTYAVDEMSALLRDSGFGAVSAYPAWDELPLYDAAEWLIYVAER